MQNPKGSTFFFVELKELRSKFFIRFAILQCFAEFIFYDSAIKNYPVRIGPFDVAHRYPIFYVSLFLDGKTLFSVRLLLFLCQIRICIWQMLLHTVQNDGFMLTRHCTP